MTTSENVLSAPTAVPVSATVSDLPGEGASPYPLPRTHDFGLIRLFDGVSRMSGVLATLALLAMALVMTFEIGSRTFLNEPTAWATEISGYLLVAVVFLGLAAAQASNSHVQVELWIDRLSPPARIQVELICQWIGMFLILVLAWQMASFNMREYLADTRDWGLLSTPQWIPQLPVTVGLVCFAMAIMTDLYRLAPPVQAWRRWLFPIALLALGVALATLGENSVAIGRSRYDWGSLLIVAAVAVGVVAWSGWRTALLTLAVLGGLALLFVLARGQSIGVTGALLAVSMMVLLLLGVRIAIALALVGLFGVFFLLSRPQLSLLAERA
ncbi:MAG: TRAP transporter small permease, partial [Burkholderiaceae bacterium]|nr:TRAP transporter small permease [Burkholderiaceae bacterium]